MANGGSVTIWLLESFCRSSFSFYAASSSGLNEVSTARHRKEDFVTESLVRHFADTQMPGYIPLPQLPYQIA